MNTETAFWSFEAEDDGFDPVTYPEIKPYTARLRPDDELGLRRLLEWPEALAETPAPRRRRHHSHRRRRPQRKSR